MQSLQTARPPIPEADLSLSYFDLWAKMTESYADLPAIKFPAIGKEWTFAETKAMALQFARAASHLWCELVTEPIVGSEDDPKALFVLPIPIPSVMQVMKLAFPKLRIPTYAVSHLQMSKRGKKYINSGNAKIVFVPDVVLGDPQLGPALIDQLNQSDTKCIVVLSPTDYTPAQCKDASAFAAFFPDKLVLVTSSLLEYDDGTEYPINANTNLAAIYNTSGTTGLPKGIKVPMSRAGNLYNAYLQHPILAALKPGADFFVTIPMHHPTANEHTVTVPWLFGCTLYLQPSYNKEQFPNDLLKLGPNAHAMVAPEHAFQLLECDLPEGSLSHIDCLQLGGSPITPAVMARLIAKCKWLGIKAILFGYGASEDGPMTFLSSGNMDENQLELRPCAGVEYRIVDDNDNPVKPGELGRLQLKPNGCTYLGYFKRLDLDAEAYTADGWRDIGDVAQEVRPGVVMIHDRFKYSYVIYGIRHFTFPLRNALTVCEDVVEAEAVKLNLDHHVMTGHVVIKKGADKAKVYAAIMQACEQLPEAERPVDIAFVESFDTNFETGKRLKEHLPDKLDGYGVDGQRSFH
jgi:acyl-coenzyme A synthetase/AMP-(fatty) acid ligase